MGFPARVEPLRGKLPTVHFKWDPETEILSGQVRGAGRADGLTGTIELEGSDGSFAVLDVVGGQLRGIEVVVWPVTRTVPDLAPPQPADRGRLLLPARASQPGIAAVEVDTSMAVEKSPDEAVIHLRIGLPRRVRAVQVAENLMLELDDQSEIAGFWFWQVPPFPRPPAGASTG
jgi:hypothetical protein